MLEVKGVSAGYGRVEILWDVGLRVNDGEIVALVGPNGAGKTTLLRTISGLIAPSAGRVDWQGRDVVGLSPEDVVKLGIAHVPEGRRLFPGLTVQENLVVGAYHRKDADLKGDLDWVVGLFPHLGPRLGQLAGRLSGGEQQMCAIARGLMSRPGLLMIDELSLGLAPNLVELFLERLIEIAGLGTAVLLVEQDVDAALHTATRGYVLETGRIVAEGDSATLLSDPKIKEAYLGIG